MVKRIQLKQDVYMQLDSQWQIVLSGSVIDLPDNVNLSASHATLLSPAEPGRALPSHGKAASIRNVRTW